MRGCGLWCCGTAGRGERSAWRVRFASGNGPIAMRSTPSCDIAGVASSARCRSRGRLGSPREFKNGGPHADAADWADARATATTTACLPDRRRDLSIGPSRQVGGCEWTGAVSTCEQLDLACRSLRALSFLRVLSVPSAYSASMPLPSKQAVAAPRSLSPAAPRFGARSGGRCARSRAARRRPGPRRGGGR